MSILSPLISLHGPEAERNAKAWADLVTDLDEIEDDVAMGGPERSRQRHLERGKLLPRERVLRLLDPGTPFLELSPLAAKGLYDEDIHSAAIITGIVLIDGLAPH